MKVHSVNVNTEQDVRTVLRETLRLRKKGQLTIPKEMVDELGLHENTLLEARVEDGRIVLVAVPRDQAWYWSEAWQQEEREADEQITRGEIGEPMDADEALAVLDHLMNRNEK